jgi:hypothetical protein
MPRQLVQDFWTAIESRDWSALRGLLQATFKAEYPQSGEKFDRSGFVLVNKFYPGSWSIGVSQILDFGRNIVSITTVQTDGRVDHAISFFEIEDGLINSLREYWVEPFSVPEWRQNLFASEAILSKI